MARNAADAARSTRPQGEYFSVSLRIFDGEVLVTNCTGWKSRTRGFNPTVAFIKISILKNFHEMFGLDHCSGLEEGIKATHGAAGAFHRQQPHLPALHAADVDRVGEGGRAGGGAAGRAERGRRRKPRVALEPRRHAGENRSTALGLRRAPGSQRGAAGRQGILRTPRPAAGGNAWPWPAPSCTSRRSFSWTSRPAEWTRSRGASSGPSSTPWPSRESPSS